MSESIMALKALRDAAQRRSHDGRPLRCGNGGPETGCECRMCWLDRAIASLEAAEQPKPCAGYRGARGGDKCYGCGQPFSAHQQPSAEQAQQPAYNCPPGGKPQMQPAYAPALTPYSQPIPVQPARTHCTCAFDDVPGEYPCAVHGEEQAAPEDVPPMPRLEERFASGRGSQPSAYNHDDVAALHAACVRIAAERDEARRELEATKAENTRILRVVAEHERSVCDERARADKAEAELAALKGRDSVPREMYEAALAQARREGLREALALVERDRVSVSMKSQDSRDAAWNALAMAADGIRALAEEIK